MPLYKHILILYRDVYSPCYQCDHRCCYECGPAAVCTGREQVTVPRAMERVPTPIPVKREKKKKEKKKGGCVVL
jgi:hypothetical protein